MNFYILHEDDVLYAGFEALGVFFIMAQTIFVMFSPHCLLAPFLHTDKQQELQCYGN